MDGRAKMYSELRTMKGSDVLYMHQLVDPIAKDFQIISKHL